MLCSFFRFAGRVLCLQLLLIGCKQPSPTAANAPISSITSTNITNTSTNMTKSVIYLAGGCFWGTEHFLRQIHGVANTQVGYANGHTDAPTYKSVCSGSTGFAEAVKVEYFPAQLPLPLLLQLFFKTIDPTLLNQQGNDVGTQYRTGIYYTDEPSKLIAQQALAELSKSYHKPLVVECMPLRNFFDAEDYHQDYLLNNPRGYCHISPSLFTTAYLANSPYKKPSEEQLKAQLTPLQYAVTQQSATEPPFSNRYDKEFAQGIYVDITTGEPLFSSTDKFNSGCGWPAFSKPIRTQSITNHPDNSHGMQRIEVRSAIGEAHLGHLFSDAPKELGGWRYCINSAALRFVPLEKMEQEGYASYLYLFD